MITRLSLLVVLLLAEGECSTDSLCSNGLLPQVMKPVVNDAAADVVTKINITEHGSLSDTQYNFDLDIKTLTFTQVQDSAFKESGYYMAYSSAYIVIKLNFCIKFKDVLYKENGRVKKADYSLSVNLEIIAAVESKMSSKVEYLVTGMTDPTKNDQPYNIRLGSTSPASVTVPLTGGGSSGSSSGSGSGDSSKPKTSGQCTSKSVCVATGL